MSQETPSLVFQAQNHRGFQSGSESWLSSTFSDMEESETDESSDYVTPSYDVEESEGDKSFDHETFSTIP